MWSLEKINLDYKDKEKGSGVEDDEKSYSKPRQTDIKVKSIQDKESFWFWHYVGKKKKKLLFLTKDILRLVSVKSSQQ